MFQKFFILFLFSISSNCFCGNTSFPEPILREEHLWIALTNDVIESPDMDVNNFRISLPSLSGQIEQLQQQPAWLELWGTSFNAEGNEWIVPPHFISILSDLTGEKVIHKDIYHAGLLHTHGYLFSNLKTPYGYKRKRWISSEIEENLKLPTNALSPYPEEGNFFINTSFLAAKIAFKNFSMTSEMAEVVSSDLANLDFSQYTKHRIEEVVDVINENGENFSLVIHTDLVSFLPQAFIESSGGHLLVYSIQDSRQSHAKLITLFPTNSGDVLLNQLQGEVNDISLRYNGFVNGLSKGTHKGIRKIYTVKDGV